MADRNAVAGVSEVDLNKVTKELFHTLQPTGIFKLPDQRVEDIKITISVSIDEESTVDSQDSTLEARLAIHFRETLLSDSSIVNLPDNRKDAIFKAVSARLSNIGFSLRVSKCLSILLYDSPVGRPRSPTTLHCLLELIASVTVNADPPNSSLRIEAHDGNFISVNPENATLDSIVNGAVLPLAIRYINEACSHGHIDLKTDLSKEVAIQRDRLVAYSALGRITPDMPPAADNWPAGAFIGADAAFLTAAGNAAIARIQTPREVFNWAIFSGEVHVSFGNLSEVTTMDGGVGDVDTTLSADAGASVTVKLGWPVPNFTFGARIGARINLTVQASVSNEQLYMDIRSVNLFDLAPDLSFIPDWLENFIDTLIDPLKNELGRAVSNLIQGVLGGLKYQCLGCQNQLPHSSQGYPNNTADAGGGVNVNRLWHANN